MSAVELLSYQPPRAITSRCCFLSFWRNADLLLYQPLRAITTKAIRQWAVASHQSSKAHTLFFTSRFNTLFSSSSSSCTYSLLASTNCSISKFCAWGRCWVLQRLLDAGIHVFKVSSVVLLQGDRSSGDWIRCAMRLCFHPMLGCRCRKRLWVFCPPCRSMLNDFEHCFSLFNRSWCVCSAMHWYCLCMCSRILWHVVCMCSVMLKLCWCVYIVYPGTVCAFAMWI